MRDFFQTEAKFDEVYFFAENASDLVLPNGARIPTYPSFGTLRSFLRDRFEQPFLSAGDNCWFFFAGHGMQYANRDYLMPIDASPRDVEATAIPVSYVRERLSRCGADNVILILDACRSEGSRDAFGIGTETQQGEIAIYACSPTQKSWEIDELQQGAFTYALLEALRLSGESNCATVERLSQYLRFRVPELCRQYCKAPEQTPRISADPAEKLHFILLPQYATLIDIAVLKNDAYRAVQLDENLDSAEQIWIRILAATQGRDIEAIKALQKIAVTRLEKQRSNLQTTPDEDDLSSEVDVDYSSLRDLLKAQRWGEADLATLGMMLAAVDRKEGWLDEDSIRYFPCTDLQTISRLWAKYSNGRFGFAVQKSIYLNCGGKPDYRHDDSVWEKFANYVGWRTKKSWLHYEDLNFSNEAPFGHFPVLAHLTVWYAVESGDEAIGWVPTHIALLMQKLVRCNIQ